MSALKDRVDGYMATIERLEPEIHAIDAAAAYASIAISLKRIADSFDKLGRSAKDATKSIRMLTQDLAQDDMYAFLEEIADNPTIDDNNGGTICRCCGEAYSVGQINHHPGCLWVKVMTFLERPPYDNEVPF